MSETGNDEQMDVGSVVEAVSADHSFGAPLYVVESMCMRCGENVCLSPRLVSLFVASLYLLAN